MADGGAPAIVTGAGGAEGDVVSVQNGGGGRWSVWWLVGRNERESREGMRK